MEIQQKLQNGLMLHRSGDKKAAETAYLDVISQDPLQVDALHLLAVLRLEEGRQEDALENIDKALQVDPEYPAARLNRANILMALHRPHEAIRELQELSIAKPDLLEVYINLGNALLSVKKFNAALIEFDKALKVNPNHPNARMGYGLAQEGLEHYAEAAEAFRGVLKQIPNEPTVLARLASVNGEMSNLNEALQYALSALAFNTKSAENYYNVVIYAGALAEKGDPAGHQALQSLENITKPESPLTKAAEKLMVFYQGRKSPQVKIIKALGETFSEEQPTTLTIEQAEVVNDQWYVIKDDVLYIDPHAHIRETEQQPTVTLHPGGKAVLSEAPPKRRSIDEPVFLMGGCGNYYHWIIDHLPNLMALEQANLSKQPLILLHHDPSPNQLEALTLLGIDKERLCFFSDAEILECSQLLLPYLPDRRPNKWDEKNWWWQTTATPKVSAWLKERFAPTPKTDAAEKIFISRSTAKTRRVVNEAEIANLAKAAGYRIVEPGMMSFKEQVSIFSAAKKIVAPHGAGLTNMVFAPDGVEVVEFVGEIAPPEFFEALAKTKNAAYQRVTCRLSDGFSSYRKRDNRFNDFIIDPEEARSVFT